MSGHDDAHPGAYLVTICPQERKPILEETAGGETPTNEAGLIVQRMWAILPEHFPMLAVNPVVIFSNHVHGIVLLGASPRGGLQAAVLDDEGGDRHTSEEVTVPARRITDRLFFMCESLPR